MTDKAWAIGGLVFCSAAMLLFWLFFRHMVYGINEQFGWGFLVGVFVAGTIVAVGAHIDANERLEKQRAELLADHWTDRR